MAKLFLVLVLFVPFRSRGQLGDGLDLKSDSTTMRTSWNLIAFDIPASKLDQLHASKGEKINLKVSSVEVNGERSEPKHVRVRGNTSSFFRRKSFNIHLKKKVSFHSDADTFALKKFFAICLNMDKNYVRNKISYNVLSFQHVYVPLSCYANLEINSASEGVHMIFYPPADFAEKKCNASLVIRRGHGGVIDKLYKTKNGRDETRNLKAKFNSLYGSTLRHQHGEQLYKELSQQMNLERYFTFLAFNHLFQNGDYADELYFFWDAKSKKFDIIPWDLDDILRIAPHEGFEKRDAVLGDKLIFSSEDKLDVAIANDPYVYREYLKSYSRFLNELTPDALQKILNSIYQEVYVYFQKEEIIAQSKFDQYGATNLRNLETDLSSIFENINNRATILRNQVKEQLSRE